MAPSEAREREASLMTIVEDVVLGVLRRRGFVLAIYAGVAATALLGIFFLPPTYRASGKLLVTRNRAEISTSPERTTELQQMAQVSDVEVASQIQILRSGDLVEGVLERVGPQTDPQQAEPTLARRLVAAPVTLVRMLYRRVHGLDELEPTSPHYWQLRETMQRLEAANLGGSSVVEVAFTDRDPARAQDFVNDLMDAYVERHAQLQQIGNAEDFFTSQSEILRGKLATSEAELRAARERAGVLAGQQQEIHARLNEFSAELARTRIARLEQEERVRYLESLRSGKQAARLATPQLLELEAKRAEMVGRYRADGEKARALDAEIARLRASLSGYDAVTGQGREGEGDSAVNPLAARATLAALRGKEQAIDRERAAYQTQAEFLDAQNFDLARIERQVKLDEEAYVSYVRTAEQSRLSNALEQSKLLRLRIIERATLPLEAVSPKKGLILFFALFGGAVLAIGAGLARDQLDPHVKSAGELARAARLEILATIPPRV